MLNIKIEDDILNTLSQIEKNDNMEECIKKIIVKYIELKTAHKNDPVFNLGTPIKSGFSDVSTHHDKYIYSKK